MCLEALLHGLGVFILCDKSGEHSSESIPAKDSHYKLLNKNCSTEELIEELNSFNIDRLEISEETKKKHSKEKWIDKWNQTVYNTPFNIKEKSTLEKFL